jgi:hypothetical protein
VRLHVERLIDYPEAGDFAPGDIDEAVDRFAEEIAKKLARVSRSHRAAAHEIRQRAGG